MALIVATHKNNFEKWPFPGKFTQDNSSEKYGEALCNSSRNAVRQKTNGREGRGSTLRLLPVPDGVLPPAIDDDIRDAGAGLGAVGILR